MTVKGGEDRWPAVHHKDASTILPGVKGQIILWMLTLSGGYYSRLNKIEQD